MSEKYFRGKITFINNDKQKATIEYVTNNKIKTIQAVIDEKQQEKYVQLKLIKKAHRFLVGDNVKFIIKKSSNNVFFADHVLYEFNNALEVLVDKALISNKFLGYVKVVDEKYYIKEIDSYLFFPLKVSKFEIAPTEDELAKPVSFKFIDLEKPEKMVAELYNHQYLPGFLLAIKQHKKEEEVESTVTKVSPYGVFVTLTAAQLPAKLPMNPILEAKIAAGEIKEGAVVMVKITHLTSDRIVIAPSA
jgi:ribosomal protein S1